MDIPNGISSAVQTITPEDASALLDANIENNRNISEVKIREYVSALENDEWTVNGEAIKISANGHLLDGQHRLTAVVRSGIPMTTLVVFGLDEPSIVTMDTGKPRTLENVLAMRKVKNRNKVATVLRTIERFRIGGRSSALARGNCRRSATITACLRLFDDEPEHVYEVSATADRLYDGSRMSTMVAVVAIEELRAIDRDLADQFLDVVCTGKVNYDHPVSVLRETLRRDFDNRSKGGSPNYMAQLAWVYKAWNAWVEDRSISLLRYTPVKERFPEPKDPTFGM